MTQFGLDLGTLLGGVVVTETVFGLPGLGQLLITSIDHQDLPTTIGLVLLASAFVVTCEHRGRPPLRGPRPEGAPELRRLAIIGPNTGEPRKFDRSQRPTSGQGQDPESQTSVTSPTRGVGVDVPVVDGRGVEHGVLVDVDRHDRGVLHRLAVGRGPVCGGRRWVGALERLVDELVLRGLL